MARVKSHVIRVKQLNHSLGLQNTLAIVNSLRAHIYLYNMFPKISYAPSVVHARIRSYFRVIFFIFFFRPAFSLLEQVEALIFSLNVSNFAGGVHGHQAIVSFLPLVTTVDHGY